MGRKFRVLQIGGHDLGSLFKEKEDVEWDYLDDAVFHFESGYIDAVQEILKAVSYTHL